MARRVMMALGLAVAAPGAIAEVSGIGVGAILGEPSGVSAKMWHGADMAVDAVIGWSDDAGSLTIHADHLWHLSNFGEPKLNTGKILAYYGLGARLVAEHEDEDDDTVLGLRVPLGFTYLPNAGNFDIFAEFVPTLDVIPDTEFEMGLGIGARYYFR